MKSFEIRFSGELLGRPLEENTQQMAEEKKQLQEKHHRRNGIEDCFGVGRRRYVPGRVRTRLASISETAILWHFALNVAVYFAGNVLNFL